MEMMISHEEIKAALDIVDAIECPSMRMISRANIIYLASRPKTKTEDHGKRDLQELQRER